MRALLTLSLTVVVVLAFVLRGGGRGDAIQPAPTEDALAQRPSADLLSGTEEASRAAPALQDQPADEADAAAPEATGVVEFFLHDGATGVPALSRIALWRLGLPEDSEWTAGDARIEGQLIIPPTGLRIEELPHGRYRAVVFRSGLGAEDAPEFLHDKNYTRVELPIVPQGRSELRVHLYDDLGRRLTRVERIHRYGEVAYYLPATPDWTSPRRSKTRPEESDLPALEEVPELSVGNDDDGEFEEYGERYSSSDDVWEWIEDAGGGFDFGGNTEPQKSQSTANGYGFRLDDARAEGHLAADGNYERVYVGVLPDPRPYLEVIELEGPDPALDLREHVTVTGSLIPIAANPDAAWRDVPIKVRVEVPGYQVFEFTNKASQMVPRVIRPKRLAD